MISLCTEHLKFVISEGEGVGGGNKLLAVYILVSLLK
jgi:hypothetical protein